MTRVNRVAAASRALVEDGRSWTGLFVDRRLPDGAGFTVVERAHALALEIPAIVATPRLGSELGQDVNYAFDVRATCLPVPVGSLLVSSFVRRADKDAADDEAEDELFIQRYAAETGKSLEWVKMQVLEILAKTGGRTLAQITRRIRREAAALEARPRPTPRVSRTLH